MLWDHLCNLLCGVPPVTVRLRNLWQLLIPFSSTFPDKDVAHPAGHLARGSLPARLLPVALHSCLVSLTLEDATSQERENWLATLFMPVQLIDNCSGSMLTKVALLAEGGKLSAPETEAMTSNWKNTESVKSFYQQSWVRQEHPFSMPSNLSAREYTGCLNTFHVLLFLLLYKLPLAFSSSSWSRAG